MKDDDFDDGKDYEGETNRLPTPNSEQNPKSKSSSHTFRLRIKWKVYSAVQYVMPTHIHFIHIIHSKKSKP